MTAGEILKLTDPKVLFSGDIDDAFRALARTWHPDTCRDVQALEVFKHLGKLRDAARKGIRLDTPVVSTVDVPGGVLFFEEKELRLQSPVGLCIVAGKSLRMLRKLSPDLLRRVPEPISDLDTSISFTRPDDSVSMLALLKKFPTGVPQRHVAWIVSRLFELVMETSKIGQIVCCGIVPESMLVLVKDHGVIPLDWRFAVPVGFKLVHLPGKIANLAPPDKRASVKLDLESVHRLALVLLGDASGIGNVLVLRAKKEPTELSPVFLNWFRTPPNPDPVVHYTNYRAMLEKVWGKPKYYLLEL